MAANEDPKNIDAADKAYQAAVEAVPVKPVVSPVKSKVAAKSAEAKEVKAKPAEAAPVEPAPKPLEAAVKAATVKPAVAPAVKKPAVAKTAPKMKPAAKAAAKIKPVAKAKPKPVEKVVPVKPAAAKPAAKVATEKEKPAPAVATPKAAAPKAAKTAPTPAFAGLFTNFILEDTKMDMSANFSGIQDAMTEAQSKAKDAFEKSTKMLGEVSDFTKGNVEAVVESGKILAEGMQSLGSELVSEGRSTFEAITGDIKELAAAKSPTDFFKIQSDMMRKNFDSAVAYGSKNSETMLKLASDVMAPISGRVSMAMEKVRSVSL